MSEEKHRRRPSRPGPGGRPPETSRIGATWAAPTRRGTVRRRTDGTGHRRPGTALASMAVFLLLAGVASALLTVHLHNRSVEVGAVSPFAPATHAIVIVLDGVDPGDLNLAHMPNLRALQQNGVSYTGAWVGQMETTAATSAATIGTGRFPRAHRLVGDVWYDGGTKNVVRPTTSDSVLVGGIDTVMEPSGVGSIAAQLKARRPTARVLSVAGTNCAAAAAAATWVADYEVCAHRQRRLWSAESVAGHELPPSAVAALRVTTQAPARSLVATEMQGWNPSSQDHWIAREAVSAMRATRPTLTFVNFPEMAILRHDVRAGLAGGLQRVILRGLDADIGRIVRESKREGAYRGTIFAITAGRASEPIRTRMTYNHLSTAIVAAGGEATYLTGDGAALIGLRDPLQAQPVAQALQSENSRAVDAVYFKAQSGSTWSYHAQYLDPALSATFAHACSYLLSTFATATSPDVVVVYRPDAGLVRGGQAAAAAGTLGLAWGIQHVPLILAGHGVYAGRTSSYPARLVDLAPTLETALGLPLSRHDGTILRDALYGETVGNGAQDAERAKLAPLTAALQNRVETAAR